MNLELPWARERWDESDIEYAVRGALRTLAEAGRPMSIRAMYGSAWLGHTPVPQKILAKALASHPDVKLLRHTSSGTILFSRKTVGGKVSAANKRPTGQDQNTRQLRDPWSAVVTTIASGLYDHNVDAVLVTSSNHELLGQPISLRVDRVLQQTPQYVFSFIVRTPGAAAATHRARWALWPWPWDRALSGTPPRTKFEFGRQNPILATLVKPAADPRMAGALLVKFLHEELGLADAESVRVQPIECAEAEAMLRLRKLEGLPVAHRRAQGSRARVAITNCDKCGQPLSDPESVFLGIGPECRRFYDRSALRRLRAHPHIEAKAWIGCCELKEWRRRIVVSAGWSDTN